MDAPSGLLRGKLRWASMGSVVMMVSIRSSKLGTHQGNRRLSYAKRTLDVDVVVFHDEVIVFDFVVVVRPIVFFRDIPSKLVLEVLATMEAAF